MFDDKAILVTGGTGSVGKNFVKFFLSNFNFKKLIIFSRDELKQFQMQKEIQDERLRFFIGDVRDLSRLQRAFYGVDIVVHAAALKQVPMLEYNPFEAVKTKFSLVRYGNVLGSRGSIVEVLLKNPDEQVVHLTHQEMTRFWITFDQSFQLVLFALENMVGGEIFVPKIPSMRLVDLFEVLVPQARKEVVGIRPGEKGHEALLTDAESRHAVELDKYFVILPQSKEIFDVE